jgi:hypothetical protein
MEYKILSRSKIGKEIDHCENNSTYNFNVPLAGFSDYDEPLMVGDVIGIILKSEKSKTVQLKTDNFHDVDLNTCCIPVYDTLYIEEEHFFSITKIEQNGKEFTVKPVFINSKSTCPKKSIDTLKITNFQINHEAVIDKKVIRKKINIEVTKSLVLNIDMFSKYDMLVIIYIEKLAKSHKWAEKIQIENGHYEQLNPQFLNFLIFFQLQIYHINFFQYFC